MDVLFILGNGFDLQLGLPTRYQDFYQYYTTLESKSESIKRLKETIKEKPQEWSDLELALGEYTSQTNTIQEYCEAYDDLQIALGDYILTVDEMMKSGDLKINAKEETIETGFTYPESVFSNDVAYTIEGEYISKSKRKEDTLVFNINILTFNYTHVVETYLQDKLNMQISSDLRFIHSIQHIHREILKDQTVWVGVDNEKQIYKDQYRNDPNIQFRILKPKIISVASRRLVSDANRMLNSSDVLVIFGASLGPSDLTWTKMVATLIEKGAIVLLFFFNRKTYTTDNAKLIDQEIYRSEFVEKMKGAGVNIIDTSKIFVEINSSIFTDGTPNNHDENLKLVLKKLKGKGIREDIPMK